MSLNASYKLPRIELPRIELPIQLSKLRAYSQNVRKVMGKIQTISTVVYTALIVYVLPCRYIS